MAETSNTKTIIISITAIIIAGIIYFIINNNNSPRHPDEQEAVKCGNKTIYHYKYPSQAYPVFTRDYNTEVTLTTDVLKRISDSLGKAEIGVDAKNKVVELQEKLNQDNITFSTALRTYFMNINADPCNDTLRQQFLAFTNEMSRRMLELRSATAQVTTITEKGTSSNSTNTVNPTDTGGIKSIHFAIVKDSSAVKKSIIKLDELLQTNKMFNKSVHVLPAVKL